MRYKTKTTTLSTCSRFAATANGFIANLDAIRVAHYRALQAASTGLCVRHCVGVRRIGTASSPFRCAYRNLGVLAVETR